MYRAERTRAGFTVAGILLSTFVFLLLAPFLIQSLGTAAEHALCYADRRKAMNRIAMLEHFLKAPAFYCGLGMPLEPDAYKAAFRGATTAPFSWEGPIVPTRLSVSFPAGSALRIAYALPGSTSLQWDAKAGGGLTYLPLQQALDAAEVIRAEEVHYNQTQHWITFPGSIPQKKILRARTPPSGSGGDTKLYVDIPSGGTVSLQKNDRIHLFRALYIYTKSDILYTQDYRASGEQPRIYGIRDLRFEVDLEKQLLTVYVLARGDRQYQTARPVAGRESLPAKYRSDWDKKTGDCYQLFAEKIVWGLPNCTKKTLLERHGATEQF